MLATISGGKFEDLGAEETEAGLFSDTCSPNGFLCTLSYASNAATTSGGRPRREGPASV